MGRLHSLKVSSQKYQPPAKGKTNSTVAKPGEHGLTQAVEAAREGRPVLAPAGGTHEEDTAPCGALPLAPAKAAGLTLTATKLRRST